MADAPLQPVVTMLRGKGRMLRVSIGTLDGKRIIDMALLTMGEAETGKGLAIELETLPALLIALQAAGGAHYEAMASE